MEFQLNLSNIPFDLFNSLECGQVFRWRKEDNWWVAVIDNQVVKLKQHDNILFVKSSSNNTDENFIRNYLRLNDSLPEILGSINKDQVINGAISKLYGLRLIKQNHWECLASFICATYKNIISIRMMISNICRRLGQKIEFEGKLYYTFPEPEIIADADIHILEDCSLGYRAKFLQETAKRIVSREVVLSELESAKYETVRQFLLGYNGKRKILSGVGPKVADCVMLFSLEKLDAFPIDVWIRRSIKKYYFHLFENGSINILSNGKDKSIRSIEYIEISQTMRKYFGGYSGYAQQYLFHYARVSKLISHYSEQK
ncbi:DNA-3-methyladenine glycosylase family protein [Thermoproteota archaeon]